MFLGLVINVFLFKLSCTAVAHAIHAHGEVRRVKRIIGASIHESRQLKVLYFLELATTGADEIGVAHIGDALILHLHAIEEEFAQDASLDEQFHSIIYGGAAHMVGFPLELIIELLDGERVRQEKNLVENRKSFRSLSVRAGFKETGELF